jgi:hypothetical protein
MVATTLVSREAIELVFRLCEQQPAEISWDVLNLHFDRLGEELISAGALVETTPSATIVIPVDLDDELVGFEWDADRQAFVGFHPNMGLLEADPRVRKRYRIDFEWLLFAIASAARVSAGQQRVCLVRDQVWDLGDAWFGRRKATILFARRLGQTDGLDLVCDALTRRVGRLPGILLTTTGPISRHVVIPGQHRVLYLPDCIRGDVPGFVIDTDIISGVLNGTRPQRPAQLIEPSTDFRIVRALGQTFTFKGDKQRSILEYMYHKWLDGEDRVSVAEMIADLDVPAKTRVRDVFKKHPAWDVLLTEKQGSCWFLL